MEEDILIYLFLANGFEEVEALTPLDYLRRCELPVKTVAVENRLVTGSHQITVMADLLMSDLKPQETEMIILPGGMPGTLNLEKSQGVQEMIDHCAKQGKYIAAICAAPSILGHKGLLNGKKATCYVGFEDQLLGAEYTGEPVVQDGNIITARGAGTANQFAFRLAEILCGRERAETLKAGILWE
jgi:4-methyl-5(b-hydroxyethyl)-thiazole monophosphate biosynthesis